MNAHKGWAFTAAVAALTAAAAPASAQRYAGGERVIVSYEPSIEDRFSDAVGGSSGMRLGGFLLRTFASQEIGYDDNVFAAQDKRGSFSYLTAGGGSASSDWKRHRVYAAASAAYLGYTEFAEENAWVGDAAGGGAVDINRDISVGVDVSASRQIDLRGDPDSINAADKTVTYQRYRLEPWLTAQTGRFFHIVAVQGETTNYPNATTNAGATINLAAKEYEQVRAGYRLGYRYISEADPSEIFVRFTSQDRNSTNDAGIPNENFTVKGASAGITGRITPVIAGLAAVGIQHVTNDNPVIPSADVPTFDLQLRWEPMRTLRLDALVQRDFASSIVTAFQAGSPGYVRTFYGLRATTEIREGLVGVVNGGFINRNYIDTDLDQEVWAFDVGLRYALGNGFIAAANWLWRNETQNGAFTYNKNIVLARLSKSF